MLDREDLVSATGVLNAYVAVDKETFKVRLSLIIPIPHLFTPIDFKSLHDELVIAHHQILELITRREAHTLPSKENTVFFDYLSSLGSYYIKGRDFPFRWPKSLL